MNKFVLLFYGTLFLITYVIHAESHWRLFSKVDIIVPFVGYKLEWWCTPLFYIDWYIKAFATSLTSIFPIMFITMTQSYLNNHVKELA